MQTPLFLLLLAACADDPKDTSTTPGGDDTGTANTDDTATTPTNQAPSAPEVAIQPAGATDTDDLVGVILSPSIDPEGQPVSYLWSWSVDGAARADLTGENVSAAETSDGQVWELSVVGSDGVMSSAAGTASLTIGVNQPPSAGTWHLEPAVPNPRDDINLVWDTAPSDPDDTPLITVKWYENEVYNASRDNLSTIGGAYVDGGDTFRAVVTVSDGHNDPLVSEASVTVLNTPPTVESVTISPSSPLDDDDLEARVDAEDPDGGPLTYTYRWYRDGVEATDVGDTDIVDESFTTPGETWGLIVTVADAAASVDAAADDTFIAPWTGSVQRQVFSVTLTPDGSGGFTASDGTWAIDYLTYGSSLNDCEAVWMLDASENSRYCRDCAYSFEATYTWDPSSVVNFGCSSMQADGTGYFFFNEGADQFNSYNGGPAMSSRDSGITLRITGDGETDESSGSSVQIMRYSTDYSYDSYGNVLLYMYYYNADITY